MKRKSRCTEDNLDKSTPGYYIRKYRLLKGLSATELARKATYTLGENILQFERNDRSPNIQARLKIAKVLEIPPIVLFPELNLDVSEYKPIEIKVPLSEYSTKEILNEIERRIGGVNRIEENFDGMD